MGKPGNKSAKLTELKDRVAVPKLGKHVMYIGMGSTAAICSFCGHKQRHGMLSVYKDEYYCNERCIKGNLNV